MPNNYKLVKEQIINNKNNTFFMVFNLDHKYTNILGYTKNICIILF